MPPSEQFSGLHIATYRPSDHAGSAVGLHDCLYRGAKTGNLKLREQLASGVVQPTAQQHLPGVPNLAPDPSLPDVRNGGQQQIPTSLDFSLSSLQQDLNLGTPEDAAFLHTNYRIPSIASHLSNSCIAATRALLYPSHPRLSSWDRPMARRLCHLLVRTPLLLPIPEGGPLRLSATDT